MLETVNDMIEKTYDYFGNYYVTTILVFHILYFFTLWGIVALNVEWLDAFNVFIHSLICIFLMFRFNPYREKPKLKPHDSVIIFTSSFVLLLNMSLIEIIKNLFPKYADSVEKYAKII
jgi:hypothetical protein